MIVRRDYFSPEEKELYLSLFSDAKRQFSTYVDSGTLLNSESMSFFIVGPNAALRLLEHLLPDYSNEANGKSPIDQTPLELIPFRRATPTLS